MLRISKACNEEIGILTSISRRTFFQTFAEQNTAENMDLYLERNMTEEVLTKELGSPSSSFYLVKENETVCGYFKIEFGSDDHRLEIERLYVDLPFQKKGYGIIMMKEIEKIATEKKKSEIFLGVWQENHKAVSFYQKCGFEIYDVHHFQLGNDAQKDWLMRKPLPPNL